MLHTRKQFANILGITEQQVAVYIGRRKIIEVQDGTKRGKKIDDELPENIEFMETKRLKNELISSELSNVPIDGKEAVERARAFENMRRLNSNKKEIEIAIGNEEIELIRLKKQKILGHLIPTEIMKTLVGQLGKSIQVTFQQAGEDVLMSISKKKNYPEKSK